MEDSKTIIGITTKILKFNNHIITFKDLSDTPDWKYTKIFENEIEEVKAIIIVFSLINRESFENCKNLIDFILKTVTNNYMPLIICGNKSDLIKQNFGEKNFVKNEEINEYLKNIPNSNYFEISCKNNTNINHILKYFQNLDLEIKEDEEEIKNKKAGSKRDMSCTIQ
jgi:GTPase SAR1 family protein